MKWKHDIPNKFDFMRVNTFNFIENEKLNTELEHELNAGKINTEFYQSSQVAEDVPVTSKSQGNLTSGSDQNVEEKLTAHTSRTYHELPGNLLKFAPKRYTTKCYLKPVNKPCWYTESLFLNIGSTKRKYGEKIYFKSKLQPFHWTETMLTEVDAVPKKFISEITIPFDESEFHYMSLEPQQFTTAAAN